MKFQTTFYKSNHKLLPLVDILPRLNYQWQTIDVVAHFFATPCGEKKTNLQIINNLQLLICTLCYRMKSSWVIKFKSETVKLQDETGQICEP